MITDVNHLGIVAQVEKGEEAFMIALARKYAPLVRAAIVEMIQLIRSKFFAITHGVTIP